MFKKLKKYVDMQLGIWYSIKVVADKWQRKYRTLSILSVNKKSCWQITEKMII